MIRTCSTSLVRSDGLVEPQPETKANVMEILIRAQLVEAECGTVVDFWSAPAGIPNTRPALAQEPSAPELRGAKSKRAKQIPERRQPVLLLPLAGNRKTKQRLSAKPAVTKRSRGA